MVAYTGVVLLATACGPFLQYLSQWGILAFALLSLLSWKGWKGFVIGTMGLCNPHVKA